MTDPWHTLRRFTQARIGLGRAGHALPTSALLEFQLAHASARDAVHAPWDIDQFARDLAALGLETLTLATPISDRIHYLKRPDLGRRLDDESQRRLQRLSGQNIDIALIVSNGLSSTAVERHGVALLQAVIGAHSSRPLRIGPICLVANGRVALSDEIGALLGARLAVVAIGERPGLSAADSLGIYLTYDPHPGNTDAERNCISNIRPPAGLGYEAAAAKLLYLSLESLRRRLSGFSLKDETPGLLP
jgi:ethanolamine ammonia-lyase small subunit